MDPAVLGAESLAQAEVEVMVYQAEAGELLPPRVRPGVDLDELATVMGDGFLVVRHAETGIEVVNVGSFDQLRPLVETLSVAADD